MAQKELKNTLKASEFLKTYEPEALLETVETLLNQNASRNDLLDALDDFRQGLDETSEDIVLDVMDRLVGFCDPDQRL